MALAAELERLSAAAVTAMSQRDWEFTQTSEAREVLEHIAPDWTATFDNYPDRLNFSEQIAAHQKFMQANPTTYYQLQSMSTVLAPAGKEASVFLEIDIRDSKGMTIRGQSEFRWRYSKGKWLWYYHLAMRGSSEV